jgi:hypothetical protein
MPLLQKIKNLIKPGRVKLVRERDRIKPFTGNFADDGIFTYGDGGFSIRYKGGDHAIHWNQLEKLTAYKIDLMTFDEICINIVHGRESITISEDTPGWHKFVEKTKTVLPGVDKEWDTKIAYPSFATNLTVIYEKAN